MGTTRGLTGERSNEVEVVRLTQAQYNRTVKSELKDLGVTYRQLRSQARSGQFTSLRARKLWLAIGEPGSGRR
jgi:hypothetical protein